MVDITQKQTTLRKAIATAVVRASKEETISAIRNGQVPKGNVFEFARAAGLLGVKKTSDVIPDCHPLPVEYTSITYTIEELTIIIRVEVHTIYRTGVEVEAMHGAAVTALTMYDMLKPIDKQVEISTIKLEAKSGGKSDFARAAPSGLRAAVVICSDDVASGLKADETSSVIMEKLQRVGVEPVALKAIAGNAEALKASLADLTENQIDLVIFSVSSNPGDGRGPLSLTSFLEKETPGIIRAAQQYALQRSPDAMFYEGTAGFIGSMLCIMLPGSAASVAGMMDALFPQVLRIFRADASFD